ncbi:MAG TPA: ABC transporter permease [Bacteroidota bacterium]|nr:ABC transporter permease [Bacteroidota bacterium]
MDLKEVIRIALSSIKANKLRSVLTLLGIVIGVFSIIGVMTAVRVLQNSIESGMSQLGSHTFQIQKMPMFANRQEWLKARQRKDITYEQALAVVERMTLAKYVGLEAWQGGKVVQAGGIKTNPNVGVAGETIEGFATNNWNVLEGRLFTTEELQRGATVVVLGAQVAKKIFPKGDGIGTIIRVDNYQFLVIGILEEKGAAMGGSSDNFVAIPLTTFFQYFGKNRSLQVMVKAKEPEVFEDAIEEARFILRTVRNVPPGAEDDFSIFSNDSLIKAFNDFTYYVKMGIGFISFISLLAAGVGIMNIMLVSVTERTREIGIRKAIGARKTNILSQFLTEAIVLCQIGGLFGILLGVVAGNIAAIAFEIPPIVPLDWAFIGFALCALIGIIFGVYPAWKAANLDPIEALRYE